MRECILLMLNVFVNLPQIKNQIFKRNIFSTKIIWEKDTGESSTGGIFLGGIHRGRIWQGEFSAGEFTVHHQKLSLMPQKNSISIPWLRSEYASILCFFLLFFKKNFFINNLCRRYWVYKSFAESCSQTNLII